MRVLPLISESKQSNWLNESLTPYFWDESDSLSEWESYPLFLRCIWLIEWMRVLPLIPREELICQPPMAAGLVQSPMRQPRSVTPRAEPPAPAAAGGWPRAELCGRNYFHAFFWAFLPSEGPEENPNSFINIFEFKKKFFQNFEF